MSRPLRVVLGIVVALVLLVAAAAGLAFWKLSGLKEQLRAGLAKSLDADVQVASLDIDPFKSEIRAAGIKLTNQRSSSPWEKGDIAQATVHYRFADLLSSPLKVQVEITTWNVHLHSPLRTNETPPSNDAGGGPAESSAPSRLQVTQITAHEGTVEMDFSDDRKVTINGVGFRRDRGWRHVDHAGAGDFAAVRHAGPWRGVGEDRGRRGQAHLLRPAHAVRPGARSPARAKSARAGSTRRRSRSRASTFR